MEELACFRSIRSFVVVGLALAAAAEGWLVTVACVEHLRRKKKKHK